MPDYEYQPFHLQKEFYSVPLTVYLPDFPVEVVEAFMRSLHRGVAQVRKKDFPEFSQLQQLFGIQEAGGFPFPSIYGAIKEPIEEPDKEQSEAGQEQKEGQDHQVH